MVNRFGRKIFPVARSRGSKGSWKAEVEQKIFDQKAAEEEVRSVITGGVKEIHNQAAHTQTIKSPMSMGSGIVHIPEGLPEAEVIKVTINTEGAEGAQNIVLGRGDIFKIKGGAGWTQNPSKTVYGSESGAKDTYPLFLDDLCSNTYIFHMVRIETFATTSDSTEGRNARKQLYKEWLYATGDVGDRFMTKSIDIRDDRNPFQQDNNITNYEFKVGENRLDRLSCFVLRDFLPNVEMTLRFYVTAVANGRI